MIISLCFVVHVGICLYWITVGSVIHVYVIQAWKFSAFPRISVFCVCLVVIFFTLKTRVFIAKGTKNRNVGPTKLCKTNIKIGKYYISQDWNNNYRNPCPYLPSVPILEGHSDFRPENLNWDVRFSLYEKKKKTIMITDYGNREKRYNQHITCQLARFYNKSKLNSFEYREACSCIKKGANKQLRFEIFVCDSRKILVGPKCPYTHAVKYQPWNRIPVQTELITLYRQRKKNIGALF